MYAIAVNRQNILRQHSPESFGIWDCFPRTRLLVVNHYYLQILEENFRKSKFANFRKSREYRPCSIISTRFLKWGRIAHPIRIEICCTILIPVCLACHDFLLLHTAFRKGNKDGIPRAEATTANALAVVFRTYSSRLSMSGRIVEII